MPEPDRETIRELLISAATIAIVGCSPNPERDSHRVARYLKRAGYRIVPVNPDSDEILGQTCHPSLSAIPAQLELDIIDVFRRSEHVPGIVDEIAARATQPALWLQIGCSNPQEESRARNLGLFVVSELCLMSAHRAAFE